MGMFQSKEKRPVNNNNNMDRIEIIKMNMLKNELMIENRYLKQQIQEFLEDPNLVKRHLHDHKQIADVSYEESLLDGFLNTIRRVYFRRITS